MADVNEAVQFVLRQEDARLSGEIANSPNDQGGATRYGISSKFHPELVESGYFDLVDGEPKVPNEQALAAAELVYQQQYGAQIQIAQIANQDVANRLLSFAVNLGSAQAVVLLKKALNTLGYAVAEDGVIDKPTLAAINAADPQLLIANYRLVLASFYRGIVERNPKQATFLQGWLNRVKE